VTGARGHSNCREYSGALHSKSRKNHCFNWLISRPVTPKVAGSSPVAPLGRASVMPAPLGSGARVDPRYAAV